MQIITREAAKAASQTTYFTGKPCSKGHVAPRSVANWNCLTCASATSKKMWEKKGKDPQVLAKARQRAKQWREENTDRAKESQKAWRNSTKETRSAYGKAYRLAHHDTLKKKAAARRKNNPEYLATQKQKRQTPEYKAQVAASNRKWREKNSNHMKAVQRAYRTANRQAIDEAIQRWRKANPEKARAIAVAAGQRRRATIVSGEHIPAAQIRKIYARGICAVCTRTDGPMEIDHIKALSRGGSHSLSNLQLLCRPCNRRKHNKDAAAWERERLALAQRTYGISTGRL